jgi:hypothetical protein
VSPGPYGKTRLAVIGHSHQTSSYGDPKDDDFFVGWVTKDVESFVVKKTEEIFGRVQTVPLVLLPGPVPEPTELSDEEKKLKEKWEKEKHEAWERGTKEFEAYQRAWKEAMKRELWPF